ncbi:response regulator transcription factor [Georgenia yuyongxinii]|uniref:Response regulator transcription factor n=1 Tax=Georgenia yuyongxinii TaxID=2589797 RepID=A0A552WT07_9MICO|nr:response regulator transcription factor [Georgenia yuyongxinii]TRW45978.1 response regulator transcription factor [Georgenia yuyongxinii]
MTLRVLLADDHPLFLDGLRLLLETAGLQVVGTAADGATLLQLAERVEADVAVVDLDMPGTDGAAATEVLVAAHPDLAVLVLTMHDDAASVHRALRAGARGYVLKGAGHGAVVRAVRAVAEGDVVISGDVRGAALSSQSRPGARPATVLPALTDREHEILSLVARGHGNAAIAARLHLSLKTVQNYVSALLMKLQVPSRAAAVALARDADL